MKGKLEPNLRLQNDYKVRFKTLISQFEFWNLNAAAAGKWTRKSRTRPENLQTPFCHSILIITAYIKTPYIITVKHLSH